MIVIAGFQWTTSGGNPSNIDSAKKRIVGAIVGLALMAGSYTILNLVNPNTLTLRLPDILLINPASLTPKYCDDETAKYAFIKTQSEVITNAEEAERIKKAVYDSTGSEQTSCQSSYVVQGGGSKTCRGVICQNDNAEARVCAPNIQNPSLDECYKAHFVATLVRNGINLYPDFLTEVWDDPPIDTGETELHGLCDNGRTFEVDIVDSTREVSGKIQVFLTITDISQLSRKVEASCGSIDRPKFKGFFFIFEMNENNDVTDEDHYIGINGKDLGDYTAFQKTKWSEKILPHLFTLDLSLIHI